MDGHFVPSLTFGADIVRALRRLTRLPLDVHLLVDRPSTLVEGLIAAGSDSITMHVEAPEPAERILEALGAVRRAGLGPDSRSTRPRRWRRSRRSARRSTSPWS